MYILHLSDLHFGTTQDANRWYGQLADDLRGLLSQLESNQSPHLDALIISGDIANKSLAEEYEAAERFINRLLPEFGLQRHQIMIVAGNHDLNWKLSEQAYGIQKREAYEGSLDNEDILNKDIIVDGNYVLVPKQREYEERFKHFSNFYENVIGKPYPRQYGQQYELRHFPEQNLLILGLNSAWKLNHHENYRSRASINPDALNNALGEINQTPTYRDSKLKIAVWHHPLNSPYEDRIKDHGFMQKLAVNNFRLAFHGHIHRANAGDYKYSLSQQIDIIAAGTFGAPVKEWVPGYPLQYNLLKWQDNTLTVYTRKRIELNGAWQPDAMWLKDGLTASSYYQIKLWNSEKSENITNEAQHNADERIEEIKPIPQVLRSKAVKKILILAANPKETSPLRLDEEVREIDAGLERAQNRDQFELLQKWAVRPWDIQRAMLDVEPQIVHFSGHGTGDKGLVFEDEIGQAKLVSGEALAALFELFADKLECVLLNGCYSEIQAEEIAKSIPYVIGMKQAIGDRDAIEFAVGFYDALGAGRSVEFAYQLGCTSIKMAGLSDSLIPVLHKRT